MSVPRSSPPRACGKFSPQPLWECVRDQRQNHMARNWDNRATHHHLSAPLRCNPTNRDHTKRASRAAHASVNQSHAR